MGEIGNQDEFLKEREQLLTDEEILELDGIMLGMNEEIGEKAVGIMNILREFSSMIRKFRDAYCRCKKDFEKTKADLEKMTKELKTEKDTTQKIVNNYNLLKQSYKNLQEEYNGLDTKLKEANLENDRLKEQIWKKDDELAKKEKDVKETKDLLSSKTENIRSLTEEIRFLEEEKKQYELQQERMPALIRLYHAYQGVMEKKSELPREFFECMQNVVPLDDFDGFLPGALRESYPISYYLSVQSFITRCNQRGEVSGEALKSSLRILDVLLSAVFDLGSAYWESEKLFRIDVEAGEPYDIKRCKYIDNEGGLYGNIVEVWLHGFRDEKNDETYYSYVEGE